MQTLEQVRKSRGVTKKACASRLSVSLPIWDRFEENPSLMRVGQFKQICNFLYCDDRQIFFAKEI